MNDAEIYDKLTPIFQDVLDDDNLKLHPALNANNVEAWDSMSNVHLMLSVERAFGIRLSAGQIASLENVGDLVQLIQKLKG